jgi:hypothetical protein
MENEMTAWNIDLSPIPVFAIEADGETYKVAAIDLNQAQLTLTKRVGIAVSRQTPLLGGIDIRGL